MDSVLTSWHEAGCKTVAECKAHSESHKPQKEQATEPKRRAKSAPTPPRYGEFDINTAFDNALKRSYGED
jgi:DNA replication protein DnaD